MWFVTTLTLMLIFDTTCFDRVDDRWRDPERNQVIIWGFVCKGSSAIFTELLGLRLVSSCPIQVLVFLALFTFGSNCCFL